MRRILLPTDFSAGTHTTLAHARELARRTRAELHLLHVTTALDLPLPVHRDPEERVRAARRRLEQLAEPAAREGLAVVCTTRAGKPAAAIVQYARDEYIELIAMSTHGRTGLAHAVMGSVAEQVIRNAPCPVLAVRPASFAGHRADLSGATERLISSLGDEWTGDRREGWDVMSGLLSRELDLDPAEAGRLLAVLEADGAIAWHEPAGAAEGAAPARRYWAIRAGSPAPAAEPGVHRPVDDHGAAGGNAATDLLHRAIASRASDVHIDPEGDDRYEVRFRIDGRLEHFCYLDRGVAVPLMQQFKVMASLDIADPFVPKEGRLELPATLADLEVRITTAPVQGGTAMALRLLGRDRALMPLERLGLAESARGVVDRILRSGAGLLLVTGPTGSGKTTTIYSLLNRLAAGGGRNIVSIEDPVEFPLPFIRQMAVDPHHHVSMTSGLRTILRMDPDVVFVGEIRDVEAAEIAMRAASSGRFVVSTLHTRDVASTVTALRDLHIDNRSLAGNLAGIVSQRLLRRLCPDCSTRTPIEGSEAEFFLAEGVAPPAELSRAAGCSHCRGTGYRDRIGAFEVAQADGPATEAILAGAPEGQLRQALRASGTVGLLADALGKVSQGITTIEEARSMKWA